MRAIYCKICMEQFDCMFCGFRKRKRGRRREPTLRRTDHEEVMIEAERQAASERWDTWCKLRKFRMKTTGIPDLDERLRKEYGPWET